MGESPLGTPYTRNHTGLSFRVWLKSLTIMSLRFMYIVAGGTRPYFSRLSHILTCAWNTFYVSIHPSMMSTWGAINQTKKASIMSVDEIVTKVFTSSAWMLQRALS